MKNRASALFVDSIYEYLYIDRYYIYSERLLRVFTREFIQEGNLPFLGYFLAKELHEWLNTRRKWKFIQKYLKKNIQKCRSQLSGSLRRTPVHCAKWLRNSRNKRLILQPCKNLPSAWSDLLAMAVTPSFQLRIAHHLKHWIVDFLRFEMVYSIHQLDFIKCSKISCYHCHQEYASWQVLFTFSPCNPDSLLANNFQALPKIPHNSPQS